MHSEAQGSSRRLVIALLTIAVSAGACGGATAAGSNSHPAEGPSAPRPLEAPKTTAAQETLYLADVGKADTTLDTYIQKQGDVALRAIVTDGSAFCAYLQQGLGLDSALTSLAVGVRSIESTTHLPLGVTTFNTIEASALIALCPEDQKLLPNSDRARLRKLTAVLGGRAGS